ncbi:cell cycle checkpoint control protein RAD9A-like [Coccinella septempunctata]|uniref:cell cycle checkpoint control protein RAD9A-like n=1 Tax=Coccinella septempunctata TaxID=41139 RepID=UPI001D080885|nr:cell cycle checkpoint control protein RAD9A-like [Coccinella septempunctata]
MNCIVPAQNMKILSKAINALAKVGDEIYLEADEEKLTFTTLNMSKTVCSQCSFMKSFFSSYFVETKDSPGSAASTTCKLFMKSVLPLFKGNLEKKLEFLKVEYEKESDFILLKMKYKYDQIMMIHKLRLMDSETLSVGITPNSGVNNLCGNSSLFTQILSMFNLSDSEITLEIMNSRLVARNFYVGGATNPKLMRVEVKLSAGEFLIFDVKNNTNINFALRPLRTVISFAENFNLPIGLNFDSGGKPLTFLMKHPTFNLHFIVSTLNPNRDLQSSMASTSLPASTQRNNNLHISIEDQQALANENWDEFDLQNNQNNSFISMMNRASSTRSDVDGVVAVEKPNTLKKMNSLNLDDPHLKTNGDQYRDDADVISQSSDSPRDKRMKLIFSRCYEPTIVEPDLGKVYVGNSDSE